MHVEPYAPGTLIGGKYRVVRVLGQGGMGVVVEALQEALGQPVAIKVLHPHVFHNADLRARFLLEAKVAAQLDSEHIVRVHDLGDGDDCFIAMDLLQGQTLEQLVETQGPLPVKVAVDLVAQACKGIAHAHKASLVHRDIKPANLFLARRADGSEIVKILDFGLIKDVNANTRLTTTAVSFGSPSYMSPEQIMSAKHVDCRTDQHALAVTLFELLTGRLPYEADSPTAVTVMIATTQPVALSAHRQDVPVAVWDVILRALAKSPESRFATVADFAIALGVAAQSPDAIAWGEDAAHVLASNPAPRVSSTFHPLRSTARSGATRRANSGTIPLLRPPFHEASSSTVKATHSAFASGTHPLLAKRVGWIGVMLSVGIAAIGVAYFAGTRTTSPPTPASIGSADPNEAPSLRAMNATSSAVPAGEAPVVLSDAVLARPSATQQPSALPKDKHPAPPRRKVSADPIPPPQTSAVPTGEFVPSYRSGDTRQEFVPGYAQ